MTPSTLRPIGLILCGALAALAVSGAAAQDEGPPDPTLPVTETVARYAVGASIVSSPSYSGADRQQLRLAPMWAFHWGRLRLSTGPAGGLLRDEEDAASGASAELFKSPTLALNASLRFDKGRMSSSDPALEGLADVRRTLRLRLGSRLKLTPQWRLNLTATQDLLGRRSGGTASVDLAYVGRFSPSTTWSAGAGLTLADATYMAARFGVPRAAALPDRPAFDAGGGLRDAHAGLGLASALGPHLVLFANLSASRLLQDAAASPLSHRNFSALGSVGLAWRCCQ